MHVDVTFAELRKIGGNRREATTRRSAKDLEAPRIVTSRGSPKCKNGPSLDRSSPELSLCKRHIKPTSLRKDGKSDRRTNAPVTPFSHNNTNTTRLCKQSFWRPYAIRFTLSLHNCLMTHIIFPMIKSRFFLNEFQSFCV